MNIIKLEAGNNFRVIKKLEHVTQVSLQIKWFATITSHFDNL